MAATVEALAYSWQRAWTALGAPAPQALLTQLLASYMEPHRHYHTQQHLHECLDLLESALPLALHPGEVELALWFHDSVYNPQADDNELRSAEWAARALLEQGTPAAVAYRVQALVLATAHATPPQGPDEQLLVDVDLGILAATAPRFAEYQMQIRAEYQWVPEPIYLSKRHEVLQGFLQRPFIYGTVHFHDQLELIARHNLQSALSANVR